MDNFDHFVLSVISIYIKTATIIYIVVTIYIEAIYEMQIDHESVKVDNFDHFVFVLIGQSGGRKLSEIATMYLFTFR